MKMQKILISIFSILLISSLFVAGVPQPTMAQETKTAAPGNCGKNFIELGAPLSDGPDADNQPDNCIREGSGDRNPIYTYLKIIIRFLSAGVGIVVVLMIIVGGIRYITSSGNPEAAAGAKKMITNAVIALVLFLFMAAILNFLIPGGLL